MKRMRTFGIIGLCAIAFTNAAAQDSSATGKLDDMQKCVSIQIDNDRLACFDSAMNAFTAAVDSGEVMIMDKAEVEAVKKEGFGLNLPSLSGLGGIFKSSGDPDIPADTKQVELALTKTTSFGYKKTRFHFANGQVWDQIDSTSFKAPKIKKSSQFTAVIKKAALGSFQLRVNGKGKKIRVKRVE